MANDDHPKEGDTYECAACGMAILLTEDCESEGDGPFFACCGQSMDKTGEKG